MEPRYCSMSLETWNAEVTTARGDYSQRRNAGQPNAASGSLSWAAPQAHDSAQGKTPAQVEAMRKRSGAGVKNLNEQVNWPNVTVAEAQKIPNKANYGQVALSNHPSIVGTPQREPHVKTYLDGVGPTGLTDLNTNGNAQELNPDWVEQLMGLPVGWTAFDCAAMVVCHKP